MSQAIVNPEEMRRFISQLRAFVSEMRGSKSRMTGNFSQLGATWRDQEYQRFSQDFEQTMRTLDGFLQRVDQEHIPYLTGKAQKAQDYLDHRR